MSCRFVSYDQQSLDSLHSAIIVGIARGFIEGGLPGIGFSNGKTWTETRRTSLQILKNFGLGKNSLEEIIDEEVQKLVQYIEDHWVNKPIDMSNFFSISVLSSLWRIISGESLPINDVKLKYLCQLTQEGLVEKGDPLMALANQYPTFFKILIKYGYSKWHTMLIELMKYCKGAIDSCKERKIDGNNPLTFIEAMLHKIQTNDNVSRAGSFKNEL